FAPPRYQDIRGHAATLLTTPDGGALIRLIAGEVAGHRGPGSTYTPITIAHITLEPGAQADVPWRSDYNALVYVLGGRGSVGRRRHPLHTGQLAVHGPGDALRLTAER